MHIDRCNLEHEELKLLAIWLEAHFKHLHYQLERVMSDLDTLNSKLDAVSATVAAVATDLADTAAALKALQGQVNPDLSGVIAKVDAIQSALSNALNANPDPGPPSA